MNQMMKWWISPAAMASLETINKTSLGAQSIHICLHTKKMTVSSPGVAARNLVQMILAPATILRSLQRKRIQFQPRSPWPVMY